MRLRIILQNAEEGHGAIGFASSELRQTGQAIRPHRSVDYPLDLVITPAILMNHPIIPGSKPTALA